MLQMRCAVNRHTVLLTDALCC